MVQRTLASTAALSKVTGGQRCIEAVQRGKDIFQQHLYPAGLLLAPLLMRPEPAADR
jgi:hypothetical protein